MVLAILESEQCFSIQGEYNASELMRLELDLNALLVLQVDPKDLYLGDLKGSDSGLIALLLSFQRFANSKDWQVKLINASDGVKGLIELSQLNGFFTLIDKVET